MARQQDLEPPGDRLGKEAADAVQANARLSARAGLAVAPLAGRALRRSAAAWAFGLPALGWKLGEQAGYPLAELTAALADPPARGEE
jgi:hypothetical protein